MLITLLVINGLIILTNLAYVTLKEKISDEPLPGRKPEDVKSQTNLNFMRNDLGVFREYFKMMRKNYVKEINY